jgi:anaerobic magnesium-protoporphyrin IX monomethyl ester cyclase
MRYSKAIVINPPSPPGYVSNKDSMGGFGQLYPVGATYLPPLDLVYLTSYLTEQNCPVEVFECLGLELNRTQLMDKLSGLRAQLPEGTLLLAVRTSLPTLDWDLTICADIKQKITNVSIALFGPVVGSVMPRVQRESSLDYVIAGDPDETVLELMNGKAETEIKGLNYRSNGGWSGSGQRAFIRELDHIPFPKWELFPYLNYKLPKSSTDPEMRFLPMLTSRGCPIGCHYCPYPVGQGLPWRYRSASNVVDEIEHLVSDLGVEFILFRDPMFSLNQKRVLEICREVNRRELRFKWRCETRIDFLNEETLTAMAGAGCDGINFGVESSDMQIQEQSGRKAITCEQFIEGFNLCRRLHIKTFGFFIIGLPGDTVETVLDTIKFALDIRPNWVQFTAASPLIGTKLREWAVGNGLVAEDEYAYINSHEAIIGNENLTKEQVHSLHAFARFIQNYVLNRKGILKDDNRPSRSYRAAKITMDKVSDITAHMLFAGARLYFGKSSGPVGPLGTGGQLPSES